ncbi:CDGSH iron-sulfur domain-containing protein [Gordonia sp. OPL2]|uniref:CDGSH iron-sulfur domain-containing protein n=1 Tax=Gordonia sp. OPL2 TaxID=2486274 RepID=UPI001655CD41|nr:CDGSH iron-sulfur domain-containing protein [Gordonia sp. OPL2]ROZ86555.1 CDGSH iron-sulfur domain-containing protein [Gordonia sp. OPL2]
MDTPPQRRSRPTGHGSARITVTPGGPLVVRGDVELVDADGEPIPRHRATVALCRCGRSTIQPYCDGSHAIGRAAIRGE